MPSLVNPNGERFHRRKYGRGTSLVVGSPWGTFHGGRALCSDGKVRALSRIALTADTFFSVPAAVKVRGKTVSGYVTCETLEGLSTEGPDDPSVVKFVAVQTSKNHALLPGGAYRESAQQKVGV